VFLIGVRASNAIGINACSSYIPSSPIRGQCDYEKYILPNIYRYSDPFLAPNGLVIIFSPCSSSAECHSWNHETAQFYPVHFDDQAHIRRYPAPEYSPDRKLLPCWSRDHFYIRVWDMRTRRLVFKFPTSRVDRTALSPALIDHSLADRLITLRSKCEVSLTRIWTFCTLRFWVRHTHTWHLYELEQHWHNIPPTFVSESRTSQISLDTSLFCKACEMGQDDEPLFWVPVEHRGNLYVPSPRMVIGALQMNSTILDFSNSSFGRNWTECIDKGWLRELDQKEKEGNLLE